MSFKKLTIALSLPLFIFSCGESNDSNEVDMEKIVNEVMSDDKEISIGSPCELVLVDDVRSICNVGSEFEISQEDKEYTHPTCTFKWEDGKVTHKMNIGGNEMSVGMPSEVMIVMVVNSNEQMFTQSTSVYKDGVNVEGVAEKATWTSKMSQLTILSNGYLFHVHLKSSNDDTVNKKQAIEVVELLMSKL